MPAAAIAARTRACRSAYSSGAKSSRSHSGRSANRRRQPSILAALGPATLHSSWSPPERAQP